MSDTLYKFIFFWWHPPSPGITECITYLKAGSRRIYRRRIQKSSHLTSGRSETKSNLVFTASGYYMEQLQMKEHNSNADRLKIFWRVFKCFLWVFSSHCTKLALIRVIHYVAKTWLGLRLSRVSFPHTNFL